jgi:hypothetical protein
MGVREREREDLLGVGAFYESGSCLGGGGFSSAILPLPR